MDLRMFDPLEWEYVKYRERGKDQQGQFRVSRQRKPVKVEAAIRGERTKPRRLAQVGGGGSVC